MITLTHQRTLSLAASAAPGRDPHISAASGLVRAGACLYVVADDEHHLGVFAVADDRPGTLVRLFDGDLRHEPQARKKHKPDLEALTLLPAFGAFSHGALLAIGSGSRENRRRGALIPLGSDGAIADEPRIVDLTSLMRPLERLFPKLNIEGAVVRERELLLFQRGNKKESRNAVIRFALPDVLDAVVAATTADIAPLGHDIVELGDIDGIALCFTDACVLPNGAIVFTAAAEDTDNAYDDGACGGSAIGLMERDGTIAWVRRVDTPLKIEGIDARRDGDALHLLLVTDADDAATAAGLYSAEVS